MTYDGLWQLALWGYAGRTGERMEAVLDAAFGRVDRGVPWRTHSCVQRSQSCERASALTRDGRPKNRSAESASYAEFPESPGQIRAAGVERQSISPRSGASRRRGAALNMAVPSFPSSNIAIFEIRRAGHLAATAGLPKPGGQWEIAREYFFPPSAAGPVGWSTPAACGWAGSIIRKIYGHRIFAGENACAFLGPGASMRIDG